MAKNIVICNSCLEKTGKKRKLNASSSQCIWNHKRKYPDCTYESTLKMGRPCKQYDGVEERARKSLEAKRKRNQRAYKNIKIKWKKEATESLHLSEKATESLHLVSSKLLGEDKCNLNYAKPHCPSLKPNKSTPKYDYSVKLLAAKHMASHVGHMVGNNLKYSKKYGVLS